MARAKMKTVTIEKPCWYKIVELGPDVFDDEVWSRLYDEEDDVDLAPLTKKTEALAHYIEDKYADESTNKRPITKQPRILRTSWCADYWRLLMTYDAEAKRFIMWRKGTYESVEKVPVEAETVTMEELGSDAI